MKLRIAAQQPLVEQADVKLDVVVVQLTTFGSRPHRVAQTQIAIPKRLNKGGNGRLVGCRHFLRRKQQTQVDVGMGKQFSTAEAAHRKHRQAAGNCRRQMRRICLPNQRFRICRPEPQHRPRIAVCKELLP